MDGGAVNSFEDRPLTEQTAEDFKVVVARMFSRDATKRIDYLLTNPLRRRCASCGDVVYEERRPVCIQAAILRRMYWGQNEFLGVIGGFLARVPEASPETLLQVIARTVASRGGSRLFFANTAVKTTVKLYGLLGIKSNGGISWGCLRARRLRPLLGWYLAQCERHPRLPKIRFSVWSPRREECVVFRKGGIVIRRRLAVVEQEADDLWRRYLTGNRGVVSSRDAETLNWIFGAQLAKGRALLFGAYKADCLIGYVIVNRASTASRIWRVMDLLVEGDDPDTMDCLLNGAVSYLRKRARAVEVTVRGFPLKVDALLRRHFNREVKLANNPFLFAAQGDESMNVAVAQSLVDGWFGCPYDGDAVL